MVFEKVFDLLESALSYSVKCVFQGSVRLYLPICLSAYLSFNPSPPKKERSAKLRHKMGRFGPRHPGRFPGMAVAFWRKILGRSLDFQCISILIIQICRANSIQFKSHFSIICSILCVFFSIQFSFHTIPMIISNDPKN